ncbi:Uncharacterised protein [Mycobacteroides abscessus subsp. abscessus]|nr:Uncharacterised protein [Mycobacteroides abscessus subsp. abscessus]
MRSTCSPNSSGIDLTAGGSIKLSRPLHVSSWVRTASSSRSIEDSGSPGSAIMAERIVVSRSNSALRAAASKTAESYSMRRPRALPGSTCTASG